MTPPPSKIPKIKAPGPLNTKDTKDDRSGKPNDTYTIKYDSYDSSLKDIPGDDDDDNENTATTSSYKVLRTHQTLPSVFLDLLKEKFLKGTVVLLFVRQNHQNC